MACGKMQGMEESGSRRLRRGDERFRGMRDKAKNDTPEEVDGPDRIGIFDRQLKVEGRIFGEESPRAAASVPSF